MIGNRYNGDMIATEFFKLTQIKKMASAEETKAPAELQNEANDEGLPDPEQFLQHMDKDPEIQDNMDKKINELSSYVKDARDHIDIAKPLDEPTEELEGSEDLDVPGPDISRAPEHRFLDPWERGRKHKEIKSMKDLLDLDSPRFSGVHEDDRLGERTEVPPFDSEYMNDIEEFNETPEDHDYLLDTKAAEILKGLGKIAGSLKSRGELFAADVVEATAISIKGDLIKESSQKLETINILSKIASEIKAEGDAFTADLVSATIGKLKKAKKN